MLCPTTQAATAQPIAQDLMPHVLARGTLNGHKEQ